MKKQSPAIKQTKAYYNKNFTLWSDGKTDSFHHEKSFQKIVTLWPKNAAIIDVGCAHAIHVPLFLGIGRNLTYTGIDISNGFIKIASRRYPQLKFIEGNIVDPSIFTKKKFQGFWAAAVLMHIPFREWDDMFTNIERICKPGSYGYISLPVAHPSKTPDASDTRHFTILTELEQRSYLKTRGWKIKYAGIIDGFTSKDVWRWYIVQLPE